MIHRSHHGRFGPVMWGALGIAFFVLVMVAVLQLDDGIADSAVGTLVLVCLVACGAALWLDSREAHATARPLERVRKRPRSR